MNVKPVGLTGQTILALIPSLITQIIAFVRIQKLKDGALIILGTFGISIGFQMILPFPYGIMIALPIIISIPTYYVRKWTRLFNDSLNQTPKDVTENDESSEINEQNAKSLKILKERLAKGEITKEEYDELKKEFE